MRHVVHRAVLCSAFVTAAAAPRFLLYGDGDPAAIAWQLSLLFLLGIVVADAPAAWGELRGMGGLWPEPSRLGRGLALALALALPLAALHLLTDPALHRALVAHASARQLELAFPPDAASRLASMLWSGGFEALFFYAFTMSLVVRAVGRVPVAVAVAVLLRTAVSVARLADLGVLGDGAAALGVGAVTSLAMALLFVRGGLPAASLLAMLVKARLLWRP